MSDKTYKKKLRNGPQIEVSLQIKRWREKLRKEGIKLGRASVREDRRVDKARRQREDEAAIAKGTKKFF